MLSTFPPVRLAACAGYPEVRLASYFCQRGQLPERRGSTARGSRAHLRLRASKQIDGVLLRLHARRGEVAVAHVVRVVDAQVGRLENHGAAEQRGVARRSRPRAEPAQRRRRLLLSVSREVVSRQPCAYSGKACGVACGRHGRARGRSPPRRPPHPPPPPLGPLGAREAAPGRAPIARRNCPRGRARRQSAFPWRARVLARPPPPRSSADGRPSRPSTPAPVRADRVRHAAGAARRTGRSSPTARAAHAREPADAAADAHAAGGPAAGAAVVHQSSVARGVPAQPIHLSCLASLPNSCRRQTASR